MRAIVIANGHVGNSEASRVQNWPHDCVICANGGAQHALGLGLAPDVVVGDLDSLDGDLQARLEDESCQVLAVVSRGSMGVQSSASFGCDDDFFRSILEDLTDEPFAATIAIDIRSINKIHAKVNGFVESCQ